MIEANEYKPSSLTISQDIFNSDKNIIIILLCPKIIVVGSILTKEERSLWARFMGGLYALLLISWLVVVSIIDI